MDWDYPITSDFEELKEFDTDGDKVEVGFRPSGPLHVGNLLTIGYAAGVADWMQLELELTCCDTDWSAHIHSDHAQDNNRVMRLFFKRDCPCGEHENIAEHRMEELEPFLKGLSEYLGVDIEEKYLTGLQGDESYTDALREVLTNMDEFDEIFGGGFRRRYISPVVNVCPVCGYSHAKGASYASATDNLVFPCRNRSCPNGFADSSLTGEIGVYYLVDPVRDPSQNVAVHVFGGDYRVAEKEQVTPKVSKVARITELATGETPAYFLAPMISDSEGKPLSKSKKTGRTTEEIDDLQEYGRRIAADVTEWLNFEKKHVEQGEL